MFQFQVDPNDIIEIWSKRVMELEKMLVTEQLRNEQLTKAIMKLHKGEQIISGPAIFDNQTNNTDDGEEDA